MFSGSGKAQSKNTVNTNWNWNSNLMLSPNPAKDRLTVSVNKKWNENAIINIYNVNGKLMMQNEIPYGHIIINSLNLKEGVYFCQLIVDGENIAQQKLVIIQ